MTSSPTPPPVEPIDAAIADADRSHRDELALLRLIEAIQHRATEMRQAAQYADDYTQRQAEVRAVDRWEADALAELDGAA